MRFEDLLELWQRQRGQQSILQFLGIRSRGDVRGSEESDPGFLRILHERLDGTWWEVTTSRLSLRPNAAEGIRCRYLADSLKDAVRRCPGAQFPPEAFTDDADEVMPEDESDVPSARGRSRRQSVTSPRDE